MQKLYSQLIGLPVFDELSPSPVALVQDVLVDPENGKILAFLVKNDHAIVPYDIERLSTSGLYISDKDRILPITDVLRVFEVFKMKIGIIGARVVTDKKKTYIGRAVDYEVDTSTMSLIRLHTAKTYFFFRFQERIIPFKSIISIGREIIKVKESTSAIKALDKEKISATTSAFAS
jgi:sporulation protein YlmC with PRC-barrel domain